MAKRFSHKRKFSGKYYYHVDTVVTKKEAQRKAENMRSRGGYKVRITKEPDGYYYLWRTS